MSETAFQPLDADLPDARPSYDKPYITEEICDQWRKASRWTRYMAVAGFVILGLLVPVFINLAYHNYADSDEILLLVLVIGSFVFILSKKLNSYSRNIRKAANDSDWEAMELAFSSLRTAYAIFGFFLGFSIFQTAPKHLVQDEKHTLFRSFFHCQFPRGPKPRTRPLARFQSRRQG